MKIPSIGQQIFTALDSRKGDWTKNARLAPFETSFANLGTFMGATGGKRTELEKRGTLTAKGIQDELRGFADGGMVPEVRRVRERITQARADLAERRKFLTKPKIDPADVAAAVLRQDMRAHVRGLSPGDRMGLLLNPATDPAILAAVLEAPAALSGLPTDMMAKVVDVYVATTAPEASAEITQAEEGFAMMDTMLTAVERDINAGIGQPIAA